MPAGFDIYSRERGRSSLRPYSQDTLGGGVRLGLPIGENLNTQVNYKLIRDEIDDSVYPTLFPEGTFITSSLGHVTTFSTLDSTSDPHEGLYFRLNQDLAGLGGDRNYLRSTVDARAYYEIIPDSDIVGFLKVTGGNITGLGEPVPLSENFYRGGETIRGFATMGFGPRVIAGGNEVGSEGTPVGGKNFVAATAEVQFPVPLVPEDFGFRGAVFADAGTLWGVDVPAGFTGIIDDDMSLRSSVGASLLWDSPFGLLRVDVAQPFNVGPNDETQTVRFGIDSAF
jgi:outer membrane protein insertion porin family